MGIITKGVEWVRDRVREKLAEDDDPDLPPPAVPVELSPEARRMREEGDARVEGFRKATEPEPVARGSVADRLAYARRRK
jgi:hypothetical protein